MKSNLSKFYLQSRKNRIQQLEKEGYLSTELTTYLQNNDILTDEVADHLIENQIGQFSLPMGVALNFIVDEKEVIVPMVVEEPSVIAACSNAAKIMRKQGGFHTILTERGLIGQLIVQDVDNLQDAKTMIEHHADELIDYANKCHPSIVKRGGGVYNIDVRIVENENQQPEFLAIHFIVDVKDAMGANIVNTLLEGTSSLIEEWTGGNCLLRILSNYNDHSLVTAHCRVHPADIANTESEGQEIAKRIVQATRYASLDPYRATTHNKGIMNGIDAVLLATGNDWRAIEAGAHAFASRNGSYRSLSKWSLDDKGYLVGQLTMPMPVGTVGGAINVLPLAKMNQSLLQCKDAKELASIIVSVGLAQNFSALKALVSEGIQRGHMSLQAKSLAIHVGATGSEIESLVSRLKKETHMNVAVATKLLEQIRDKRKT